MCAFYTYLVPVELLTSGIHELDVYRDSSLSKNAETVFNNYNRARLFVKHSSIGRSFKGSALICVGVISKRTSDHIKE